MFRSGEAHDVRHSDEIVGRIARLYMATEMSDVTFVVEGEKLPAHRVILGAQSDYFWTMLCGSQWPEATQNEVHLRDIPLAAFKIVLRYIYSGKMALEQMDEGDLFETLKLANMYGLDDLVSAITDYLDENLNLDEVVSILEVASSWDLRSLAFRCYFFLDKNSESILQHETFKKLSPASLSGLLERDEFYAPEVRIFRAVLGWYRHNRNRAGAGAVFSKIRYTLMAEEELMNEVRPYRILSEANLQKVIAKKATSAKLPHRSKELPDQNLVCSKLGCAVIRGENPSALLQDKPSSYEYDPKLQASWHELGDTQGIVVKLDKVYDINQMGLLLSELGGRSYSYYVEVSADQRIWDRVVDYREYLCRSWQFLHFPKRQVRYIRLVGTHNTVDQQFYVVKLKARYSLYTVPVVDGIPEPEYNVATSEYGATQIEGHNVDVEFPKNLVDGNFNFDSGSGFVYHLIDEDEKIVVQLGQPYRISSLRLFLLDCEEEDYVERLFSYYIETSINRKDWVMLVDKRDGYHRAWQNLTFEPRVVVFIRLVGTRSTVNGAFQCVHLECPGQPDDSDDAVFSASLAKKWKRKREEEY